VIWGVFGVIVGVFLEIRECFWTICGVFLDDCYSKLASLLLANLLIEINADIHRKIGGSKEN